VHASHADDNLAFVSTPVPKLLEKVRSGDTSALHELTPALYKELHRIASRHLSRERPNHTLQATALVHEAYLKLFDKAERTFADEVHFLAVASRVMRQVLVDYARSRATDKRSSGEKITWTANLEVNSGKNIELFELIKLDDAIKDLAAEDESLARLIEMRYFGGMTAEESAEALGLSVHVVRHDLRYAQAWLRRKLMH
jgi:RNA polymerase sigma factor (TIGR02999 family)